MQLSRIPIPLSFFSFLLCTLIFSTNAQATLTNNSCAFQFHKLRFDDDMSCLKHDRPEDFPGQLKFIQIDKDPNYFLSFGGEIRQRYAYTRHPMFGTDRQDRLGVWAQRYVLHGDLHLGDHLRFFGQIYSAIQDGQAGGPSPVEKDKLEFENAFVELHGTPDLPLTLRAGRQELQFGSGRLIDVREGPNVRRTFDALRLIIEQSKWRLDGFVAHPRTIKFGEFDDRTNRNQSLWGLYLTVDANPFPAGNIDLYYLGYQNHNSTFAQGTADEHRHTLGMRLWGAKQAWDWNWEGAYQFGTFGSGNISAWTIASDTGYTWTDRLWKPRTGLSLNIASGDKNRMDADLGTFSALYPRGNYFSEASILGPRNFYNFNTSLGLSPSEKFTISIDMNFFWRLETADGIYGPSGNLITSGAGNDKRFVGSALSLNAGYTFSDRLDSTLIYSRFVPGSFMTSSGFTANLDYYEATLRFRF